jgi:anti-sigma regulatory factor (Ser/Thr protein kinase)
MTAAMPPLAESASGGGWAGTYPLPNSDRSPGLARTLLRQAMLGCPPEKTEAAELLVSELVTNAVRHAETDLLLHIALDPGIRVAVEDTSADPIREPLPFGDDDSGRGLAIVEALAESWGWERTLSGKRTWFEL